MKSLSSFIKNQEKNSITTETTLKDVYFEAIFCEIQEQNPILERLFMPIPGIQRYGYRIDIPYGEKRPGNQKHMHIYIKQNELFALNVDGTSHDGYHNVKIPDTLIPFLKKKGFTIPPNNIIEIINPKEQTTLLLESPIEQTKKLQPINKIAIVVTNESMNTTDIICNSKVIKESYKYSCILFTINEIDISDVIKNIEDRLNDSNLIIQLINIFNNRYISEKKKIYLVWA